MAYPNYKYEIVLSTGFTATASGIVSGANLFTPGLVPHIIRGFAIIPAASGSFDASTGAVALEICQIASGATASQIVQFDLTTDNSKYSGGVYYTATLNTTVNPGYKAYLNVRDGSTGSASFRAVLYVEVSPEEPGNVSDMTVATAT